MVFPWFTTHSQRFTCRRQFYLRNKVCADLPVLAEPSASSAELTGTLAGALRALTRTPGGASDDDRGSREPKTVQEVYRETYGTLVRYCNVERAEDVAPVWRRLANCSKSERYTILTQEFQRVCGERKLATDIYVPVVTTSLTQMIIGLQFVGHRVDDLGSGCQPFQVAYSSGANHMEALEAASISNQLTQGDQNANLADIRTIRDKEKLRFPSDISQTCITLYRFAVLCQTLFQGAAGPANPLVAAQWKLADDMQNAAPFIADRYRQVYTPTLASVFFPGIVRAVQVGVHEYLHQVGTSVEAGLHHVELPDYRTLVWDLRRGTFQNSSNWLLIPEGYLTPRSTGSVGSRTQATASTTPISGASVRTGLSSITNDTPRTIVARIENPSPDPEFTSIVVRPGGFRPILQTRALPSNDAGAEFCVAWWLRGACFPNCGKRAAHVPFASAAERTRLLTFCREHLAAPASEGT